MNKNKLTLAIAAGLMSVSALAGCDKKSEVRFSPEGYILTYTTKNGEVKHYTAEDLFGTYIIDSRNASSMFDSVYKLMVRVYFEKNEDGKNALKEIERKATNRIDENKESARKAEKDNHSKYKDEWNKILESNNAIDEDDLKEKYIGEFMSKEFEEQFYDKNTDKILRDNKTTNPGFGIDQAGKEYEGYLQKKVPYHVRHILVKVDDKDSNNYATATISESNAQKLHEVVKDIADGERSFGEIAKSRSDDSGSAAKFGDLGIMDLDTSFVNEFKLGLYAFENKYNENTKELAEKSEIKIPEEYADKLSDTIGEIPYGAFEQLYDVRKIEDGIRGSEVNKKNNIYFPRNVLFNKYLNKHDIAVIVPNNTLSQDYAGTTDLAEAAPDPKDSSKYVMNLSENIGKINDDYASLAGFKECEELGGKKILCTNNGDPILVARSGTSGDSGYQGIHFISIIRDGLIEKENDVTLSEYYTMEYPRNKNYPTYKDSEGNSFDKETYVNYISTDDNGLKARADEIKSKVKSFDKHLRRFIYYKFVNELQIKFEDPRIQQLIDDYVKREIDSALESEQRSWNKTWRTYIETLESQKLLRQRRLPEVCAVTYDQDHSEGVNEELWKQGGICGEKEGK